MELRIAAAPAPFELPKPKLRQALVFATLAADLALLLQALAPETDLKAIQTWSLRLFLAVSLGLFLRRASREPAKAVGWRWLSLMLACHLAASLAGPWLPPQVGSALILLYLPAGIFGLLWWFEQGVHWAGGIRRVLEGSIFGLGCFALGWNALSRVPGVTLAQAGGALVSLITFAALLGIVVYQVRVDHRRLQGPLGWISLAFLAGGLLHLWLLMAHFGGEWSPRHPAARLNPLVQLIFGLTAFAPWTQDTLSRDKGRGQNVWSGGIVYAPFILAVLVLLASVRRGTPADPFLVLLVGGMVLLLMIRHFIALRDQASFSRILRHRLDDRTRALEVSQGAHLRAQRLNLVTTVGAGMAPDLNNLLGAVCALAERNGSREDLIKAAHQAAELARATMAQAGHPDEGRELFELGEAMDHLRPVLQELAGPEVTLAVTPCATDLWLEADPIHLEQALVNLVTNARDAQHGKGHIHISLVAEGPWCQLHVTDDGPGMDPGVRARIFDPFFTTKPKGQGTGLGLPSVKAFVDHLGGTIEVDSERGQGTRFRLRLPRIEGL